MNQQAGPRIDGFRYLRYLDSGGFSTVHLYEEQATSRQVAVKVLKDVGLPEQVRTRFVDEATAMAHLGNHPNIVQVLRVAETGDGHLYLVMHYYSQPDLGKQAKDRPLEIPRVLEIGVRIAGAVHTAHAAGILHRDIKPANILVDEFDQPGLTDFGIAGRVAGSDSDTDRMLSVPWSPPEIVRPRPGDSGGVASDVYSLGATLWHLLVGHSPFHVVGGDNTRAALESRILSGGPPETGRAPGNLERLLRRAMSHEPGRRPVSAKAMAVELQAVQRELGIGQTQLVLRSAPVVLRERPEVDDHDLTATRMSRRSEPMPMFEVVPPSSPVQPSPQGRRPLDMTVRALAPSEPVPEPTANTPKPSWRAIAVVASVLVAAVLAGGFLLVRGTGASDAADPTGTVLNDSPPDQDAGNGGAPPGKPAVTAKRINEKVLRFSWTYSAPQATDTFSWQTPDGARAGTATTPAVDIATPEPLCVQVKVVRIDGSNGTAAWSEPGCGS